MFRQRCCCIESVKLSENFTLKNEFSLDQNLNDINYNDLEANLILGNTSFNIGYLEENNHIGTANYIKSGIKVYIGHNRKNIKNATTPISHFVIPAFVEIAVSIAA